MPGCSSGGMASVTSTPCSRRNDRVLDLAIVGELQSESGALGMGAQAEGLARGQGKQRDGMVLGVAAQEQAAQSLPDRFFGEGKAQRVAINPRGGFKVVDEKVTGTEANDLKRAGQ